MTTASEFRSIVDLYVKHGWVLRRVLLSALLRNEIAGQIESDFPDVPIHDRDYNAAWFSRPIAVGPIAWEVRNLGGTPYALVEHLDENDPDFEAALQMAEQRMVAAVASRKSA